MLELEVMRSAALRFDDGSPVTAASGIARFAGGYLVVQDDATAAAWWRPCGVTRVRVLPPVAGHDTFSEAAGTKLLKPDLEAACEVEVDGAPAVLLLGSGSLPVRCAAALVVDAAGGPRAEARDLPGLFDRVAGALGVAPEVRNLEGACVVDGHVRWFQRGDAVAGVADASVDVPVEALVDLILGDGDGGDVELGEVRRYDLDRAGLGPVAVTDAVALVDGRVLVSTAAEERRGPVDDGPVTASGLALLDGRDVVAAVPFDPGPAGEVPKVEGLAVAAVTDGHVDLWAVTDQDDHTAASAALQLRVHLP